MKAFVLPAPPLEKERAPMSPCYSQGMGSLQPPDSCSVTGTNPWVGLPVCPKSCSAMCDVSTCARKVFHADTPHPKYLSSVSLSLPHTLQLLFTPQPNTPCTVTRGYVLVRPVNTSLCFPFPHKTTLEKVSLGQLFISIERFGCKRNAEKGECCPQVFGILRSEESSYM